MSQFRDLIDKNLSKPNQIIGFWFHGFECETTPTGTLSPFWFNATPELNDVIRENFSEDIEKAIQGQYDDWMSKPVEALALVILVDQFTRNLYSNSPDRVKGDEKGRSIAHHIINQNFESSLWPIHLPFVYLPFEHTESLEYQELSVQKFQQMVSNAPEALKPVLSSYLQFAVIHKQVIEKFGRFPGRNQILSRLNTEEEIIYLHEDRFKL